MDKAKEFVSTRQSLLSASDQSTKEDIIKGFKELRKENRKNKTIGNDDEASLEAAIKKGIVNRKTVAKYLREEAEKGDTEAMVILSNSYFVSQSIEEQTSTNDESNKANASSSASNTASITDILDPPVTANEALDLLIKAAMTVDNPNADAVYNLASLYWEGGSVLVKEDKGLSIRLFKKGAYDLNDPSSQFFLGTLYHRGYENLIEKDIGKAKELIDKASKSNGSALVYYCQALLSGDDGFDKADEKEIIKLLEERSGDDADALLLLGDLYISTNDQNHVVSKENTNRSKGEKNVPIGYGKALEIYIKAGNNGSGIAWNNAGAILASEYNDYDRARDCYAKGVSLGNAECIRNLAYMHAKGEGLPSSDTEYSEKLLKMLQAIERR